MIKKRDQKERRAHRTRSRIHGTAVRPRLSVHRSLTGISAQLIDDDTGTTFCSADSRDAKGSKTEQSIEVGKRIAVLAKEKSIETVLFDRGPSQYHGRVKALADAAREAGLNF